MAPGVVYLSHGRLFLKSDGVPATTIESQGRGGKFMSGMSGAALWGADPDDSVDMAINVTGCCRGVNDGEIYYALQSPEISGVLLRKNGGGEQRLLHTADFRVGHLAAQPGTGRLAISVWHRGGATMR
jgi:glucose dehydrogenase